MILRVWGLGFWGLGFVVLDLGLLYWVLVKGFFIQVTIMGSIVNNVVSA